MITNRRKSASYQPTLQWEYSCSAHTSILVGSRTSVGSFITSLQIEHSQSAMSAVGDQSVLWAVGHYSSTIEGEDKHRMRISHCSTHKLVGVSLVLSGIHQWGDYLRCSCRRMQIKVTASHACVRVCVCTESAYSQYYVHCAVIHTF